MTEVRTVRGVSVRHSRECSKTRHSHANCDCVPAYQAEAYNAPAKKKARRTFPTLHEAMHWRREMRAVLSLLPPASHITEIRTLIDKRVRDEQADYGEALPHLLVLQKVAHEMEARAVEETPSLIAIVDAEAS